MMRKKFFLAIMILLIAAGGAAAFLTRDTEPEANCDDMVQTQPVQDTEPKGYYDYTVQKQQYYVEYSEEYPYWDVLTVEYPTLAAASETEIEQLEQINKAFYDAAMDRVNYWHLQPNDEVKRLQEAYHLFTSDVQCSVPYHSQYLVSVRFREIYSPVYPVWFVFTTQRGMTTDILTGESYALSDILRVDEEFINLWIEKLNQEQGEEGGATKYWEDR